MVIFAEEVYFLGLYNILHGSVVINYIIKLKNIAL